MTEGRYTEFISFNVQARRAVLIFVQSCHGCAPGDDGGMPMGCMRPELNHMLKTRPSKISFFEKVSS